MVKESFSVQKTLHSGYTLYIAGENDRIAGVQLQDFDPVFFFQQIPGNVQGILRADGPVPSHSKSVDPYLPFRHIGIGILDECVHTGFCFEGQE